VRGAAAASGTAVILAATLDGTNVNLFVDGTGGTPASYSALNPSTGTGGWDINGRGDGTAVDIAEVIVYNSALTTEQRQDVEAYLSAKWFTTTYTGSGSPALPSPLTATGAGAFTAPVYTGNGDLLMPALTSTGAGTFAPLQFTGAGDALLQPLTATGAGTFTPPPQYTGSGGGTLAALTASGTGSFASVQYTGTGAPSLPSLTGSGAGAFTKPTYTGSGAAVLPTFAAYGAGVFNAPVSGSSNPALIGMKSAFRVDVLYGNGTSVQISDVSITQRASQIGEIEFSLPADIYNAQGFGLGKVYRVYHAVYGQIGDYTHAQGDVDAGERVARVVAREVFGSVDWLLTNKSTGIISNDTLSDAFATLLIGTNISVSYDNSAGEFGPVTLRTEGLSFLGAIDAIRQLQRGYWVATGANAFRFGRFTTARLNAATPDATLANAAMGQRRGVSDLTLITRLRYAIDASNLCNHIVAVGAGDGSARIDLQYSTRNSPYTIQSVNLGGGVSRHYIEDAASAAAYGLRQRLIRYDDVRPTTDPAERTAGANTLYDLAAIQMQQLKDPTIEYQIECVDPPATVMPGSVIVVDFRGVVEDASGRRSFLRIASQRMFVLEVRRKFDADGVIAQITVSSNGERVPDGTDALIGTMRTVNKLQNSTSSSPTLTESQNNVGGAWVPQSRTLIGGIGINSIGDLSANRTISVNYTNGLDNYGGAIGIGTPSALSVSSVNSATGTTHAHAITSSSNPGANASLLATDAAGTLALVKLRTPTIDTAAGALTLQPAGDVVMQAGSNLVKLASGGTLQSHNYASGTTGFGITNAGAADFRYLTSDELLAKSFVTDLEQALAGSQIITKSVAVLYSAFTMPPPGSSGTFIVRDLPSAPGVRVFENRDLVRFRTLSRSAGSLSVADAWGAVVLDTSYGTSGFDSATRTQRYTFIRHAGITIDDTSNDPITDSTGDPILANNVSTAEGGMAGGTVVPVDAVVLNYGKNQSGFYEITTVDGAWGANSPYAQAVSWSLHPKNATVRTREGNLRGLFSVADEFGIFAGTGTSTADQYIRASSAGVLLQNVPLQLFNAGVQTVNLSSTGASFWIGTSTADRRLNWDGSTLSITGAITVTGGNALASGSAAADVNANSTLINGGKISAASLSVITANMGTLTAGEILLGNATTFSGSFTGLRMRKSGSTYELGGYNAGTLQAYFGSDGKLKAGSLSNYAEMNASGFNLFYDNTTPNVAYAGSSVTWYLTGTSTEQGKIYPMYDGANTFLYIEGKDGVSITGPTRLNGLVTSNLGYVNPSNLWSSGYVRASSYFQVGSTGAQWVLGNYVASSVGGYTGYIEITVNGSLRKVAVYA
jgi:hypothetical protein